MNAELKPLRPDNIAPAIYHWWRVGDVAKAEELIQCVVETAREEGRAEERKRYEKLVEAATRSINHSGYEGKTRCLDNCPGCRLQKALSPLTNGKTICR